MATRATGEPGPASQGRRARGLWGKAGAPRLLWEVADVEEVVVRVVLLPGEVAHHLQRHPRTSSVYVFVDHVLHAYSMLGVWY